MLRDFDYKKDLTFDYHMMKKILNDDNFKNFRFLDIVLFPH